MSNRKYLSDKHCACCGIRLDKLKKRQIQQVSSIALIGNINFAKPVIAKKGNKVDDNTLIENNDLVFKRCISKSIVNSWIRQETQNL